MTPLPHTLRDGAASTRWTATGALMVGHVAGMIDLAALPVWVGVALIGRYGLDPQTAGGLVTAYLLSVVAASLLLGPRVPRLDGRWGACIGFGLAAVAFSIAGHVTAVPGLLALHALAGFGAGIGLTCVHGAIGRTGNPHRVFAVAQAGLGLSAILFMGIGPALIAVRGGPALFELFAAIMGLAVVATLLAFPSSAVPVHDAAPAAGRTPLPRAARAAMAGVTLMGLVQAGLFSFVERIGVEHGFGDRVAAMLLALGLFNLLPAPLAGLLQHRLSARWVARCGPVAHALLAWTVLLATGFMAYAAAAILFIAVMVFTHTFVFGWLARLDPSGRAVALTPAVLMSGAAIGPLLCGAVVQHLGPLALGGVLSLCAALALASFLRADRPSRPDSLA